MRPVIVVLYLCQFTLVPSITSALFGLHENDYLENVVVQLRYNDNTRASAVAASHGFRNLGQIGSLKGYYWFARDRRLSKREVRTSLRLHPDVVWTEVEEAKTRVKRMGLPADYASSRNTIIAWPDPLYDKQWYLNGYVGRGMGIQEAWKRGFTGKGVVVSILDDGVQRDHPDLAKNYDPLASYDVNDHDPDPYPRDNNDNKHGTRCAGEVAAIAGNNWCGVGIAYNARIGGVRMLDGAVSDRVEAESLSLNQNHIDIYSASWGPEDDGKTFDGPGRATRAAFYQGITEGRHGKGNIFIWASGNGGSHRDSCSCDGYTTSIYTLSVSSTTYKHEKPWYLEECPSTLATTYSSGIYGEPAIATIDMPNGCTIHHTGTSASAPIAAGIIALALEANQNLTWRDMQHLVVRTSDPSLLLNNAGWIVNGVGRKVSNKFGYGIMNADRLVMLAQKWKTVPPQHTCTFIYEMDYPKPLVGLFSQNFSLKVDSCSRGLPVLYLEHVQILLTVHFSRRGDLRIFLTSPMGTRSEVLPARSQDDNNGGFQKWPFMSVQQWGENPQGTWTLTLENSRSTLRHGAFHDWQLTLYGTQEPPQPGGVEYQLERTGEFGDAQTAAIPDFGKHQVQPILTDGCHPECDGGCRVANSSLDCIKCKHYSQQMRNRGGSKCVDKCESGYYLDAAERRCNLCLSQCVTCSSADYCDTCLPQLYLIISDPEDLSHGKCETECPEGYLPDLRDIDHPKCRMKCDDGCLKCSDQGPCQFCKIGYFLLTSKGTCVTSCPTGYFADPNSRKCVKCPQGCLQCQSKGVCDVCRPGTVWNGLRLRCIPSDTVKKCNGNHECPSRTFCDKIIHACEPCHPDCAECIGPNYDQCLLCNDGQKPDPSTNKCACPAGYYFNSQLVRCEKCHEACSICHGPTAHLCTNCRPGYKLLGSSCVHCCNSTAESESSYCITCYDYSRRSQSYGIILSLVIVVVIIVALILFKVCWLDVKDNRTSHNYGYSKMPIRYDTESDSLILAQHDQLSSDDEADLDLQHHNVLAKIVNNRS